jgi:hypothetical protein
MAKTLKMLRYISVSFFLLVVFPLIGQTQKGTWKPARGFTVGVNLAGVINKAINNDRSGLSVVSRISVSNQWLLLAEAGYENVLVEKSEYNYSSNGSFLKAGFEYDVFSNKEVGSNDNLLFGLHYGFALQEQGSSRYVIENGYWGDFNGQIATHTVNTHWIELSAGPRVELFKNFYMGWTLQMQVALFRANPEVLAPYLTPGYGYGDNKINAGFSFNLEYMIPWKKAGIE